MKLPKEYSSFEKKVVSSADCMPVYAPGNGGTRASKTAKVPILVEGI